MALQGGPREMERFPAIPSPALGRGKSRSDSACFLPHPRDWRLSPVGQCSDCFTYRDKQTTETWSSLYGKKQSSFLFKKNVRNNSNLKIMVSVKSLVKPSRKRKTIDAKASVSHNTTFQHQTALESDSDKLVSSTLDSAVRVLFYS